jgi:hypothetical protein
VAVALDGVLDELAELTPCDDRDDVDRGQGL